MTIKVKMISQGIGDACMALQCCQGLKLKYPNEKLIFATRNIGWMAIFPEAYDVLTHEWDETPAEKVYSPYDSYRMELWRGKSTRPELYSQFCDNVELKIPPHKELHRTQFENHVVLVPYTDSSNRNWLIQNWITLEERLMAKGCSCVIMSKSDDGLDKFVSQRVIQLPPMDVASIIKDARCVISGDTGLMHLTGLLGSPGIALTAGITGDRVFSLYPTVRTVPGGLTCNNCRWISTVSPLCASICASLQQIHPQMIADMVK